MLNFPYRYIHVFCILCNLVVQNPTVILLWMKEISMPTLPLFLFTLLLSVRLLSVYYQTT